jgi:hypothetical protein
MEKVLIKDYYFKLSSVPLMSGINLESEQKDKCFENCTFHANVIGVHFVNCSFYNCEIQSQDFFIENDCLNCIAHIEGIYKINEGKISCSYFPFKTL